MKNRIPSFLVSILFCVSVYCFSTSTTVCTFIGNGDDGIHVVYVKFNNKTVFALEHGQVIKHILVNEDKFEISRRLNDFAIYPRERDFSDFIYVFTVHHKVFVFKLIENSNNKKYDEYVKIISF